MNFRLLTGLVLVGARLIYCQEDPFHVSDGLEQRVQFWEKIFSKYSIYQVIIYDSERPERIYRILDFEDLTRKGFVTESARRELVRKTFKEIRAALQKMASGKSDEEYLSPEEKSIRSLFDANADALTFYHAMECLQSQKGARDNFKEGLIRSGKYVPAMKAIFKEEGLPEDLVYLAHVESSFHPKARSCEGAVGVWQFMKSTGKQFLKINSTLDERCDPILSTKGAAMLLKSNYDKTGTWPLAITAYNHGVNGVKRAIQSTGTTDLESIIREYRSSLWGYASKNFYAEFLAARRISQNPEIYFPAIQIEPPLQFKLVQIPFTFTMKEAAEIFNSSPEVLSEMNPALNPAIRKQNQKIPKGTMLRVPIEANVMGAAMISTGIGATIQGL
jgi:membrane-bound lytic murein transglycosylase D